MKIRLGTGTDGPGSQRRATGLRVTGSGALALLLAFASLGSVPAAEAADSIEVEMMVSFVSDEPGPVDPRAAKIDEKLKREFRYQSLRVIEARTSRLAVDEVASLSLPNGKTARVQPLSVDASGALLAVDIEDAVKVDARARSGHLLVFGAGRYQGGRLVVSIEPHF